MLTNVNYYSVVFICFIGCSQEMYCPFQEMEISFWVLPSHVHIQSISASCQLLLSSISRSWYISNHQAEWLFWPGSQVVPLSCSPPHTGGQSRCTVASRPALMLLPPRPLLLSCSPAPVPWPSHMSPLLFLTCTNQALITHTAQAFAMFCSLV